MIGIIVDGDIYAGHGIEPATPGYRTGSGGLFMYSRAYLDWFLVWMISIFYYCYCIIQFCLRRVKLKEVYHVLKSYLCIIKLYAAGTGLLGGEGLGHTLTFHTLTFQFGLGTLNSSANLFYSRHVKLVFFAFMFIITENKR